MPRVSFRQVRERFTHIDAEFVSCSLLIGRVLTLHLPCVTRDAVYGYLDPLLPYGPPFGLGSLPATLFRAVCRVLNDMGVQTLVTHTPQARKTPILLLIEGTDYIIADDFELDVPEFHHDPSWATVE